MIASAMSKVLPLLLVLSGFSSPALAAAKKVYLYDQKSSQHLIGEPLAEQVTGKGPETLVRWKRCNGEKAEKSVFPDMWVPTGLLSNVDWVQTRHWKGKKVISKEEHIQGFRSYREIGIVQTVFDNNKFEMWAKKTLNGSHLFYRDLADFDLYKEVSDAEFERREREQRQKPLNLK